MKIRIHRLKSSVQKSYICSRGYKEALYNN